MKALFLFCFFSWQKCDDESVRQFLFHIEMLYLFPSYFIPCIIMLVTIRPILANSSLLKRDAEVSFDGTSLSVLNAITIVEQRVSACMDM